MNIFTRFDRRTWTLVCGAILLVASSTACLAHPKKTASDGNDANTGRVNVGVIAFENSTQDTHLASQTENAVTSALSESNHFRVVARTQMPAILRNLKFETGSGLVDSSTKNEIGKVRGIDYLVYGSVDSANFQRIYNTVNRNFLYNTAVVDLTIYYMKTDTGDILISKQVEGKQINYINGADESSLLAAAARQAGGKVADLLVGANKIDGSVIQINPEESYFRIDLGSENGVSEEMVFAVYDKENIKLPSGEYIEDKTFICFAKPIQIDTNWTKLEPGEFKKDLFGHQQWKSKTDLLDPAKMAKSKDPQLKLGEEVTSTDKTN